MPDGIEGFRYIQENGSCVLLGFSNEFSYPQKLVGSGELLAKTKLLWDDGVMAVEESCMEKKISTSFLRDGRRERYT